MDININGVLIILLIFAGGIVIGFQSKDKIK